MPTRYFECKIDGHNKFWEIMWETQGRSIEYETRWGLIGSPGSKKVKFFSSMSQRDRGVVEIIASKLNKGYKEVSIQKKEDKKSPVGTTRDYLEL